MEIEKGAIVRRPAGLRSPTVISLQLAGWLVLVSLFLPTSRGCNGTVIRPVDGISAAWVAPVHVRDIVGAAAVAGLFGCGVSVASIAAVSACLRSPEFWWRGFLAQLAVSLLFASLLACGLLASSLKARRIDDDALAIIPPLIGGLAWVGLAMRRGARQQAWARLQHVWAIAALLYLHMLCLFSSQLLVGYWLALVGLVSTAAAVELARYRMQHDLWDASQRVERPRFTLRQLFFWMTFFPLAMGYLQAVGKLASWLDSR